MSKAIDPNEIIKFFSVVSDPRIERTKEHRLIDIIVIALCSVLCGAEGWTEIEEFGKAVLHSVSAWAHDAGIVLGEIKTAEKSNEITAIPELLKSLDIKGSIVTIDAMGCQKKIVKEIRKSKADYVLGLKGNHGDLHDDISLYLLDAKKRKFKGIKHSYYKSIDKNHGRKEEREYWVTEEIWWLTDRKKWKDLKSVGMVHSRREVNGKVSKEFRYYLSSMSADGQGFARAVRGHWGVKNSLHWVLDVCFREDECRIRSENAPENLAILRRLSLNILKHTKHHNRGIKVKMKRAGWDNSFLAALLCEI